MSVNSISTSSSSLRALPWAGGIALLIILLIDRGLVEAALPWEWIEARIPEQSLGASGVAGDRVALAKWDDAPLEKQRLVVIGASRADAGFQPELLGPEALADLAVAKLAHPGLMAFETLSLVDDVLDREPAVAVLLFSEVETHHPFELTAFLSAGSASALWDLVVAGGSSLVATHTTDLYRLWLASISNLYRYREVFDRAGFDSWRNFALDARFGRPDNLADLLERYDPVNPLADSDRLHFEELVRTKLTPKGAIWAIFETIQLRSLVRGDHVALQRELFRRSIERLRDAGCRVILVEPPLFPPATILYDPTLRDDFVAFARSLEEESGVTLILREAQPEYATDDFLDLTHVNRRGAAKLTRVIVDAVREELQRGLPTSSRDEP